jgi:NAD+--asparagine ADP-ribosyltransferase
VKGKLLLVIFPLLADKMDCIQLSKSLLRDADERCIETQAVSDGGKTVGRYFRQIKAGCIMGCIFVPELEVRARMRATVSD